jgi:hypothetical protein
MVTDRRKMLSPMEFATSITLTNQLEHPNFTVIERPSLVSAIDPNGGSIGLRERLEDGVLILFSNADAAILH